MRKVRECFKNLPAIVIPSKRKRSRAYSATNAGRNINIDFCTFDTETSSLGGKLLAATWSANKKTDIILNENPDYIVDDLLQVMFTKPFLKATKHNDFTRSIWYAHNAQYDLRYIIDRCVQLKTYQIDISNRTETDIYQVIITDRLNEMSICLRDSMALFNRSLKDFTEMFAPDDKKLSGAIDFEKGEVFDVTNPLHIEYAKQDAKSLRIALENYNETILKDWNVTVRATSASTAMAAWQTTLEKGNNHYQTQKEHEDYIRSGYFGGLVFLTSNAIHYNAETYDINSSYPASMRKYGVPNGKPTETLKFYTDLPAIYTVLIEAPDDLVIPIIPHRGKKGETLWHKGTFEATCTNYELIFAVKHGYKIHEIKKGLVWKRGNWNPFTTFINKAEDVRTKCKGTARESVAKEMQSSVYGKFGSRKERIKIFHPECKSDYLEAMPLNQNLEDDTDSYFWVRKEIQEDMLTKPEYAVFITAHSRLNLLETAYSIGVKNIFYGDTDSLTVESGKAEGKVNIGLEYGQYKLEKTWEVFKAMGPKQYVGRYPDKKGVMKWHGAAKGLTKKKMSQEKWEELFMSGHTEVESLQLESLKQVLKSGIIHEAVERSRKSSTLEMSASFEDMGGGMVRPKRSMQNVERNQELRVSEAV